LSSARGADDKIAEAAAGAEALTAASDGVSTVAQDLARCMPQVASAAEVCQVLRDGIVASSSRVDQACGDIASVAGRVQGLVHLAEELGGVLLEHSDGLPISGLAESCRDAAARISSLFERAVKSGEIRREQLFDERYRLIPGSDPAQHLTDFTAFADRVLPAIQEPLLSSDRRIVFCAAADRNGYLPTHNRKYAQPPSEDPVWNARNARSRRIFDDGASLASVRSRRPILLQSYRRDMGGVHAVMCELAAPIVVDGRHWGGFRLGFGL
jgi:methyl-accepting chemotaxis protein